MSEKLASGTHDPGFERLVNPHWHEVPAADAATLLGSSEARGLDQFEIEERRRRFGPNILSERGGPSALVRFVQQLHQPLVYVLLGAGVVTVLVSDVIDSLAIFTVVAVNAIFGFVQESRALGAIRALSRSLSSSATVLRGGAKGQVPASDLVPGDIVFLQSGDRVPADLRLLRVRDLQIDESALTGESVPVGKQADSLPADTALGDRRNMAYSSTLVTFGIGTGVVVATADGTEIGRISDLLHQIEPLDTPLMRRLKTLSHRLVWAILALAALTFVAGLFRGEMWVEMFMRSVALAVAAIPEGLPAAMTIVLAIGVSRMAEKRAIVRRLSAVETLGSTTVICSDKTGTLTQNAMTVREILAGGVSFTLSGDGYSPGGAVTAASGSTAASLALAECLTCGLLCNDSALVEEEGRWRAEGDPTEAALLAAAGRGGLDGAALRAALLRLDTLPFESQHQYMATLLDRGKGRAPVLFAKGSLERLLPACADALDAGGGRGWLDPHAVQGHADEMAGRGLRVLAFVRRELPAGTTRIHHADLEGGLTLLGLQAMMDPPRPEAAEAVAACQRAGIAVKMITGDHVGTAAAIARQIGIAPPAGQDTTTATGAELDRMSDEELIEAAAGRSVFARVSPEHKLRLVKALQARRQVVAMTGDGVNDAPALRRADIGIAMGRGGTEVAREAAAMVLTDDNFATIEAAVEEGRGIFDNLTKFLVWTLPTNGGEGLVVLLAVLLDVALPVLPVHILWINMSTAIFLGTTLAFEPKERGLMDRPPRMADAPILDRPLLVRLAVVSLMLAMASFAADRIALAWGASAAGARTVAATMFIVGEAIYLFNCRSLTRSMSAVGVFSNRWVWTGLAAMTALQVAFIYAPVMNRLFESAPFPAELWPVVLAFGLAIYGVVGVEKWLSRRRLEA